MKTEPNARQIVSIALGAVLILTAAVFLIVSLASDAKTEVDCDAVAEYMESLLTGRSAGFKEERYNNNMPALTYDGQDFSALLYVPRFSVRLPVRASWDKNAVKNVPCVFTGNTYEGTLVIGGTDTEGQFDFVPKIDIGDEIVVTDMKGYEFSYTVSAVNHAKDAKASTLTNEKEKENDRFDLTLFAKDKKTGDWLLVRCRMKLSRITDEIS